MNNLLKNWKTTSSGIAAISTAIIGMYTAQWSPTALGAGIPALCLGIGLLLAADGKTPPSNS